MLNPPVHAVPSGPPQNFQSSEVSSRSITFTWDPPLLEDQNGVITGYIINVTEIEMEESFELFSDSESLTADFVRPFSSYLFKIAGQTAVGTGTFSDPITIMTLEDGRNSLYLVGLENFILLLRSCLLSSFMQFPLNLWMLMF